MTTNESFSEVVLYDGHTDCPYLPGQIARMPLRLPVGMTPRDFDLRLEQGDRRSGFFLYRTACPNCCACEPIRIRVADFVPRENQRRAWKRGNELLLSEIGEPQVDEERVELFNRHKSGRGLDRGERSQSADDYQEFLTDTCAQTIEIAYRTEGRLVALAIADLGEKAMSAVYTFFDPTFRGVSLGTFSIMKEIDLCRQMRFSFLYLGYYVAANPHMQYKARFTPHERRIDGIWRKC